MVWAWRLWLSALLLILLYSAVLIQAYTIIPEKHTKAEKKEKKEEQKKGIPFASAYLSPSSL